MADFSKDTVEYFEKMITKKKINLSSLLDKIDEKFLPMDVAKLYNHILISKDDFELLNLVLRRINKKKYFANFEALNDFILRQNRNNDFNNLKVLAIKTLGNYNNKKAVNSLLFCLNDKNSNYKIKLASAEALGKIGDISAFESLGNIIQDENEKSAYVKEGAVIALGSLGDNRALDVFNNIINAKEFFQDKFTYLKESVVETLSKFDISKNQKALNILKTSLLDNNATVRIAAIETLMNSEYAANYDLIYDRLKYDDDIEVKKNALVALYNISDENILNEVIEGDFCDELKNYAKEVSESIQEDE